MQKRVRCGMPPKKKKARKADSVVWNDNDCRADVCLRPPGTSRWRRLVVAETYNCSLSYYFLNLF